MLIRELFQQVSWEDIEIFLKTERANKSYVFGEEHRSKFKSIYTDLTLLQFPSIPTPHMKFYYDDYGWGFAFSINYKSPRTSEPLAISEDSFIYMWELFLSLEVEESVLIDNDWNKICAFMLHELFYTGRNKEHSDVNMRRMIEEDAFQVYFKDCPVPFAYSFDNSDKKEMIEFASSCDGDVVKIVNSNNKKIIFEYDEEWD